MYTNKCTKCGNDFEKKKKKRVICPECLYPDRTPILQDPSSAATSVQQAAQYPRSYSAGTGNENNYKRFNKDQNQRNGRPNFQKRDNNFRRPQRPQGNRRPQRPQGKPKPLLVNKEQLMQIEELYKKMLPLPNPDAHEVIGEKIGLEPKKVFFGINLIRQKMMLPKIPYPKRKLAITPDQMMAIKNLYEPLLPLPPIGCHKILAAQLKMDEWRVHVGIGLVRKQMGLERWNQEREDAPEEYRKKSE